MALDLSALEEKPAPLAPGPTGKPLEIRLVDIEEDPDQPRQEFSADAMQEMAASIQERGVKTPVSVRPHPDKPGKWMLNYGARRYRGSLAAHRKTIPAFVDEAHDDYDQVIENIQRDDLKPMELALFIKKRLDAGDQKKIIAKHLGKDGGIITQHLALIDPPACIEDAYSTGKCTSPKTLYALRGLHDKYPEQVDAWCATSGEITRKMVADFGEQLKSTTTAVPTTSLTKDVIHEDPLPESAGQFGHDQISSDGNDDHQNDDEAGDPLVSLAGRSAGQGGHVPDRISKPLMSVEFNGRPATVLLHLRPSRPGLLHLRFDDTNSDQEVDASACKIVLLTDTTNSA